MVAMANGQKSIDRGYHSASRGALSPARTRAEFAVLLGSLGNTARRIGSILRILQVVVLAFLAVSTPAGPGDRVQARLANRPTAFFANAEFLVPNTF